MLQLRFQADDAAHVLQPPPRLPPYFVFFYDKSRPTATNKKGPRRREVRKARGSLQVQVSAAGDNAAAARPDVGRRSSVREAG